MPKRPHDLPSLSALTAFEAAARHVSFKLAASELNVTPAAISHQIKALEAELDRTLFRRNPRGVELTEAGAVLLVALQRGFEQMSDGIAQLRMQADIEAVTIQATTAVSSLWLAPRLAQFWKRHGHIPVSQHVTDTPDSIIRSDLKIIYGDMAAEKGDCRLLFCDSIAALASPDLLQHGHPLTIADLATLPLIHVNAEDRSWTNWTCWSDALGYAGSFGRGLRVNNYSIALQAAQDGMGVVLGWETLTEALVRSGALVKVLPQTIPAPMAFFIKARANAPARALLLRDWLLQGHNRATRLTVRRAAG